MIAQEILEKKSSSAIFVNRIARHRQLLDAIENIVRLQKSVLLSDEQLTRLEQVRHYDRRLVEKTFRDPRLFKATPDGQVLPSRMYDKVASESFNTYENRFAVFLLDLVDSDISMAIDELHKGQGFLPFLRNQLTYGPYGTATLLANYLGDDFDDRKKLETLVVSLTSLHQKATFLKSSSFYFHVSKTSFESVLPTNLLLEQKDYHTCFDFFCDRQNERTTLNDHLADILKRIWLEDFHAAVDAEGFVGQNDSLNAVLRTGRILRVGFRHGEKESVYALSIKPSFFPRLVLQHENESREISLLEIPDFRVFLSSLCLLVKKTRPGICPICQNSLVHDRCPTCHAEVFEDEGLCFVANVPFVHIGGNGNV